MPPVSPDQFKSNVKIPSNIGFLGTEEYFRDEVLDHLKTKGYSIVTIGSTRAASAREQAIRSLRTTSLFGSKHVVFVREPEGLLANDLDSLLVPRPGNQNILALNLESLDRRTKAAKTLEKDFCLIECKPVADQAPPWDTSGRFWDTPLSQWIVRKAKASNVALTLELAYYITTITGTSLYEAEATIDKLAILQKQITVTDIAALAGGTRKEGPFRLSEAVSAKAWDKCLILVHKTFSNGLVLKEKTEYSAPTIAIILLSRIWARLKEICAAVEGGKEAAKAAGCPPFLMDVLMKNASLWKKEELLPAIQCVEEAQLEVKGLEGGGSPKLILERLIVGLSVI